VWETQVRYRYEAGYAEMARAIDEGIAVRAVFGASDELALGAMAAALDRGRRVPEDVALVGFGGIGWGAHVRPSLTTVTGDWAAVAEGVRGIFAAIAQGTKPALRSIIDTRLIERDSS